MARKARNQEEMFPQKRVAAVERAVDKCDNIRSQITEHKAQLKNAEFKLKETLHANAADLINEQTEDGGRVIKYERGIYKATAKHGKESVTYTRAGEAKSQESEGGEPQEGGAGE